jgi:zinc transport system substrate-binding protein
VRGLGALLLLLLGPVAALGAPLLGGSIAALGAPLLGGPVAALGAPRYVATIQPLAAILREVAGGRAEVTALVPPGASPHTYEPRPSDVVHAESATALFHVSPLLDAWAARLPAPRRVEVLALVPPAHRLPLADPPSDGAIDPHFWTDPLTVKALLPGLRRTLCALDPPGCRTYSAGARRFRAALERLDAEVAALLAPVRGRAVVLFHPSFRYLLVRYGLVMAASLEPSPGKEPTPRYVVDVVRAVKRLGVRSVFTEPQLPPRPAEVVAEEAGVALHVLDPNGGVAGRETYADLIRYNARVLREALG